LVRLRLFTVPSPARYSLRTLHTSLGHRSSPFSPLSHNFRLSFPHRPLPLILIPTRTISLGSIFSSKPSPTPSPHAVAHVAKIEADANAHPYDVERQLALFQALSETNIQPGYELIINRWERMTEFVRSSFWTLLKC
jgi:ATP-dependent metalloprotease